MRLCFCVVRNQVEYFALVSFMDKGKRSANVPNIPLMTQRWGGTLCINKHRLIVVPLLRRAKLLPVFSRTGGWVVSLWTAPGREPLDGNSATWTWSSTNTAVSQPKQCLRVRRREVNSTLFGWLESGGTNRELVDGLTREKPGCLCFHIARLTFTHSRFMPGQSGPRSQPLPVFICTRKSLLAFKTTTKL